MIPAGWWPWKRCCQETGCSDDRANAGNRRHSASVLPPGVGIWTRTPAPLWPCWMKGTQPKPPHQYEGADAVYVNCLAPHKLPVNISLSHPRPGLCMCCLKQQPHPCAPAPGTSSLLTALTPWRGSRNGGAPQRPHLSLWHGGEAPVPVGDEGVLHGVHGETVEGGLGAHIVLEAFGHSTIESGRNRGPSASVHLRHAVCVLPVPGLRTDPHSAHSPLPLLQTSGGCSVRGAHLALAAPSSRATLGCLPARYSCWVSWGRCCLGPRPSRREPGLLRPGPLPPPPTHTNLNT